jgi:hypothetical protein
MLPKKSNPPTLEDNNDMKQKVLHQQLRFAQISSYCCWHLQRDRLRRSRLSSAWQHPHRSSDVDRQPPRQQRTQKNCSRSKS